MSAREWKQALAQPGVPEVFKKEASDKLIKAGFIEKPPFTSKYVFPDLDAFYNQATKGIKEVKLLREYPEIIKRLKSLGYEEFQIAKASDEDIIRIMPEVVRDIRKKQEKKLSQK